MTIQVVLLSVLLILPASVRGNDEKLATLKVGSEVYSNVTVTSVTATDIYFSHSRGMGNAKLKNLDSELQKKFKFDPAKASAKEKQQVESNALYSKALREAKPVARSSEPEANAEAQETPANELSAKSFLNQPAPLIVVQKWLGEEPDLSGKFVIVDFWATWCGPCRRSIPELNALYNHYKDKLVIMGISDEPEEKVTAMTEPKIDYYVGIDTQGRSLNAMEVRAIPHALLIDPRGIVRFEGHPSLLNGEKLERLMARYSE